MEIKYGAKANGFPQPNLLVQSWNSCGMEADIIQRREVTVYRERISAPRESFTYGTSLIITTIVI